MRTFDIPRVSNGYVNHYPAVPLQDMTLDEIKKKHIKTCAKANGDVSKCSKCQAPCPEGKRAIQLLAGEVYDNPPVPLYAGKTLIERAKEENLKRKKEEKVQEAEKKVDARGRMFVENWYEAAMTSGDPIGWVMQTYGMSSLRARQKFYQWQNRHPELKKDKTIVDESMKKYKPDDKRKIKSVEKKQAEIKSEAKVETKTEPKVEAKAEIKKQSNIAMESLEEKLNALMKQADDYKKKAEEYQKLYTDTKAKVDTIFAALNILDE